MLRQDLTSINPSQNSNAERQAAAADHGPNANDVVQRLDIQQSLNVLEELILDSPRVPFSRRTLVDEDKVLEQLDRIRLNLPGVFQEAISIVEHQERLVGEAETYAREILNAADQEATKRVDDLGIVQQAEAQARQVKQQLQQDCDALRSQTMAEIKQWQQAAHHHWDQMKQQSEAECLAFKHEADAYAAQVLQQIERHLSEMLRVVHNGRLALPGNPTIAAAGTDGPQEAATGSPRPVPQSDGTRLERSRRKLG